MPSSPPIPATATMAPARARWCRSSILCLWPWNLWPCSPCRIVDTRNTNGTFGGPAISGGTSRAFPLHRRRQSLRHSCQRHRLLGQRHGGAARHTRLSHHLAHRRRPADGLDLELARWPHQGQCRHRSRGHAQRLGQRLRHQHDQRRARHQRLLQDRQRLDAGVLSARAVPRGRHPQAQRAAGRPVARRRRGARLPGAGQQLAGCHPQRGGLLLQLHRRAQDLARRRLPDGVAARTIATGGLHVE